MLCTATDVGIYGLLASQSCYHSMLAPCWFTLWTSNRFLYPYILLISLEIFLISLSQGFNFFPKLLITNAIFLLVLSHFVILILTILVFSMPVYYINLSPTLIILIILLFLTQFLTGTPFLLKLLLLYPFLLLNHC